MDWWTEVSRLTSIFLDEHGLLAAFVFLLVEEAGVPIPIPGDFLMLVLGVQARSGRVSLLQAILVMQAGTMVGATVLYGVARLAGRSMVYRYGRYIRLNPERLDHAEQWIKRHGFMAVFLGRLLPGLRIVTAVACGVFSVPFRVFFPAMSLGALAYILFYTLLGYYVGPPVLAFVERLHLPLGLLGSLLPLVVLVVWIVRARAALRRRALHGSLAWDEGRRHHLRAGAEAGLLATVGTTLFMNVVVNLAGNLAFQAPGTIINQTAERLAMAVARDVGPLLLFVAAPAYVAVGVLWGALYGVQGEHLPAWWDGWKGVVFSVMPLAVSLAVVMPLLGLGFFGVGATGPVAAAGESLRHVVYGLLLGLTFPILLARRRVRLLPHHEAELAPSRA
jgi:membrane protein DedA with SNARE-associated domain